MKTVITTEKIPIKLWLDDIEDGALEQAKNLANLPFAFKHFATMPDSHQGYGMPIGGVLATDGVIVPNAVGVDIGCGCSAIQTNLKSIDINSLKSIMGRIRKFIPMGFKHHKTKQIWTGFQEAPVIDIIQRELESAKYQLGTLGSGNHFIEIQKGSDGFVWIMLHSGSRNFGLKIAKEYHEKAKKLCEKWYSDIPTPDLSFLPFDTNESQEYFESMNFALKFAKRSRKHMIENIILCFTEELKDVDFLNFYDIHHNYVSLENHFSKNVFIHRKGATSARKNEIGIIPGSQGTKSYIVKGKGNPESFMSCSHGAGRKLGRKAAQRELNLEDEIKRLDEQGIIHGIRNITDLDEAAGAYKDIDIVMNNQLDLVDILIELTPMAVIKG